jgi:hypothetical protein
VLLRDSSRLTPDHELPDGVEYCPELVIVALFQLPEVVAICDHLHLLALGETKHEVAGKPILVALHLLVQSLGRHAVDQGQVSIEHNPAINGRRV